MGSLVPAAEKSCVGHHNSEEHQIKVGQSCHGLLKGKPNCKVRDGKLKTTANPPWSKETRRSSSKRVV